MPEKAYGAKKSIFNNQTSRLNVIIIETQKTKIQLKHIYHESS